MGDVLKLQTNVPETIALAFSEGLPMSSKFGGDQIMFTLSDERRLFVSPFVASKIAAAGIEPGQPFSICKAEVIHGNRRAIEYLIEPAHAPQQSAPHPAKPIHVVAPPADTRSVPNASRTTAPETPSVSDAPTAVTILKIAGMQAIDAMLEVEQHAQKRGLTDFVFGAENLQKIWLALYIDMRKGGRA